MRLGLTAAAIARATWAHLAYTSVFERVVETSVTATAVYGAINSVGGAGGTVTVHCPNLVGPPVIAAKMCFDFCVLNSDGAHTVVVDTLDGKTINGAASITIPAIAGAFAWVFYDLTAGEWVAMIAASPTSPGGLPSYKGLGPTTDQTFTNAGYTAVNNASVTTGPFAVGQFALITITVNVKNATAGATSTADLHIFDGTAGVIVDVVDEVQTLEPAGEDQVLDVVSIVTRVAGTGLARTFGVAIKAADANNVIVPAGTCRVVVQIVDG